MSAGKPSESSRGGAAGNVPPVLQPGQTIAGQGAPEVVWSSPVITGPGLSTGEEQTIEQGAPEPQSGWVGRHVYAFESDFLDNAFVHWDHEEPTLEMIPGFKTDDVPEDDVVYPAETLASGPGSLESETSNITITTVTPGDPSDAVRPFLPDVTNGAAGPLKVREDGIEDPISGWRPTGMVFFETLSTPPRGTVYSSSLLEEFKNAGATHPATSYSSSLAEDGETSMAEAQPFFDFPDDVAAAPPDDTAEFPLHEVVIKGGGGGDGTRIFRLFGKLVLLGIFLVTLCLVLVGGSYAWYIKSRLYDEKSTGREVTITIKPGESFRSVIDGMHRSGLLKGFAGLDDRYIMRGLAYVNENSDSIKPGVYRFSSGANLNDVYNRLISGSKDFKITIPEGKTALEVGEIVAKQYERFSAERFMALVNDPDFIESVGVDAPSLEGYLYPSTYYFGPGMKEDELVKLMVATFHQQLESSKDKITTTGMTLHEHVIMASLIEREARLDSDRPMIASVIYNRLAQGMPLQIDATVNYALNDWRRLNNSDYQVEHPYNTYKFKGLPPGPIASPRIESLLATYQAPSTSYLYYVHRGDGHHAFAETYAQHLANVGRYIRERNQPGMGNAPASGEEAAAAEAAVAEDEKAPSRAGSSTSSNDEESAGEAIEISSDEFKKSPAEDASAGDAAPTVSEDSAPVESSEKDVPSAAPKSY